MDNNKIIADEAREAYRKFSKSGKTAKILFGLEKREDLKSFHDEQKQQNAYNSVNLGLKEVLIDKIIGSVQKYTDFDKNFKPKNDIIKERWEQMYVANINNTSLPPVILYKIKDEYYVYDGNHRISVAKFLGFNSIEAEVLEFLATGDKSEDIIYREKNMFDKETGLGEIMFSEPGKYNRLIQEIQKFNHFLETKKNMNVSFKEAAFRWNKEIFNPITYILNKNNIVESFDKYNINDIFLFFLDHKYYLSKKKKKDVGYLFTIIDFVNMIKTNEKLDLSHIYKMDLEIVELHKKLKKIDKEMILPVEKVVKNEILFEVTGIDFDFSEFTIEQVENYRVNNQLTNFKDAAKQWYELDYIHLLNYFIIKAKKLPEKYVKYLEYFIHDDKQIFYSIHEYSKLHYYVENEGTDEVNWKSSVLNYILEIYINIVEEIINEKIAPKEIVNFYYRVEQEYFYLLVNERKLMLDNRSAKYTKIKEIDNTNMSNWFVNKSDKSDVADILVDEKQNEFLKNFKDSKRFEKIAGKYEGIKKYTTYVKFLELLDNLGEEEFLQKLSNDLHKLSQISEIVRKYKTLKILEQSKDNNRDLGFIDFYANILKHGTKYTQSINLVDILDVTLDYLGTDEKVRNSVIEEKEIVDDEI